MVPTFSGLAAIEALSRNLHEARGDWSAVQTVFVEHFASNFLNDFITQEVGNLAKNFDHVVRMAVGQKAFIFINTSDFEYSVRILAPYPRRAHAVKWLGMRQIFGIKVGGPLVIRKLMIPPRININFFEPGIDVEGIETVVAARGEFIASQSLHHIMDIDEVPSPSIIEALTVRRDSSELLWTFDREMRSIYAEQSSVTVSRLSNVLDLALALGKPIPDDLLYMTLEPSRPYVALLSLRSMLASGHPDAFVQLQRAIDSRSETLSQGAQRLFDALTITRGEVHAT